MGVSVVFEAFLRACCISGLLFLFRVCRYDNPKLSNSEYALSWHDDYLINYVCVSVRFLHCQYADMLPKRKSAGHFKEIVGNCIKVRLLICTTNMKKHRRVGKFT